MFDGPHRFRGGLIASGATLCLGFLMFYPRVLSFGVGLGILLLLSEDWGQERIGVRHGQMSL